MYSRRLICWKEVLVSNVKKILPAAPGPSYTAQSRLNTLPHQIRSWLRNINFWEGFVSPQIKITAFGKS